MKGKANVRDMKTVSVRIVSRDVDLWVRKLAEKEGRSLNSQINQILARHFQDQQGAQSI